MTDEQLTIGKIEQLNTNTADDTDGICVAWEIIKRSSSRPHTADEINTLNWLAEYRKAIQAEVVLTTALEAARAEVERLTRIVAGGNEALRRARKASEDETRRLGYEPGALQMRWRGWGSPPPKSDTPNYWQELYGAICDALTQEGIVAWTGDGTGIVAQMIDAQVKAREKAEAENARLREALDIARKHLLNSDGFYFGPLNKAVIRSGTTQGGVERTQDGYPIGGITIHNYGQAVVQEMDAALATNETPTPSAPGSWRKAGGVLNLGDDWEQTLRQSRGHDTNETPTS